MFRPSELVTSAGGWEFPPPTGPSPKKQSISDNDLYGSFEPQPAAEKKWMKQWGVESNSHVSSQQFAVESNDSSTNPVNHKDLGKLGASIILIDLI